MTAENDSDHPPAGHAEGELWLVDLEASSAALEFMESATPRLTESCLRRWDAMADESARRERRLAHIALRILIERALGPGVRGQPFVRTQAGKPVLAGVDGIGFSLSHAGGFALIAVGPEPVGVDIERLRELRIPLARRQPIEWAAVALAAGTPLDEPEGDARLLRAWVRLEAVAKAQGRGLAPMLERLRPARPGNETASLAQELGCGIVAHDVAAPRGLFAAVALAAGESPGILETLPATRRGIEALLDLDPGTRR